MQTLVQLLDATFDDVYSVVGRDTSDCSEQEVVVTVVGGDQVGQAQSDHTLADAEGFDARFAHQLTPLRQRLLDQRDPVGFFLAVHEERQSSHQQERTTEASNSCRGVSQNLTKRSTVVHSQLVGIYNRHIADDTYDL
ncbi:hypothetical protein D3C75_717920 [compost metagenome]